MKLLPPSIRSFRSRHQGEMRGEYSSAWIRPFISLGLLRPPGFVIVLVISLGVALLGLWIGAIDLAAYAIFVGIGWLLLLARKALRGSPMEWRDLDYTARFDRIIITALGTALVSLPFIWVIWLILAM